MSFLVKLLKKRAMINIKDKTYCCGCEACAQVCPKHCIRLEVDDEGFSYPHIDTSVCVDCGLCEKVCPFLNATRVVNKNNIFAAINANEEIRMASSSGGVFSALSETLIADGGVVYGAAFDNDWSVCHIRVDDITCLERLRGSKYVQSKINNTYKEVEADLKCSRIVLFSGTPCQVKGLKLFLRKSYENLITVEVVCHGVPSPKVWQSFLTEINPHDKDITSIQFRNKKRGWSSYSIEIQTKDESLFSDYARNCLYINGFIQNLYIRPSCSNCPAKSGSSMADITLADYWGVSAQYPELNDEKGVSAILTHSEKGEGLVQKAQLNVLPADYDNFVKNNVSYTDNSRLSDKRELFWKLFPEMGILAVGKIRIMERNPLLIRALKKLKRIFIK